MVSKSISTTEKLENKLFSTPFRANYSNCHKRILMIKQLPLSSNQLIPKQGSIREDLTLSPEDFLKNSQSFIISNSNQKLFPNSSISKINKDKNEIHEKNFHFKNEFKQRHSKMWLNSLIKKLKPKEDPILQKEDIRKLFQDTRNRISKTQEQQKVNHKSFPIPQLKQENSLKNYCKYTKIWDHQKHSCCLKVRKKLNNSVMNRNGYNRHKKIELENLENAWNLKELETSPKWEYSLRKVDEDPYITFIPIGTRINKLWMKIKYDPYKVNELIEFEDEKGEPEFKTYKCSQYLKNRELKLEDKLKQICPFKDQKIKGMKLIGTNILNSEYNSFMKMKGPFRIKSVNSSSCEENSDI